MTCKVTVGVGLDNVASLMTVGKGVSCKTCNITVGAEPNAVVAPVTIGVEVALPTGALPVVQPIAINTHPLNMKVNSAVIPVLRLFGLTVFIEVSGSCQECVRRGKHYNELRKKRTADGDFR